MPKLLIMAIPSNHPLMTETTPLFLAPMAELTHGGFRALMERMGGCHHYFTEMISASGLCGGGPFERYYLDIRPVPEKTTAQLIGSHQGHLLHSCEILQQRGFRSIDLNLGCSSPDVLKKRAGAALLRQPEILFPLLEKIRKKLPDSICFSVKIRLGDNSEDKNIIQRVQTLENCGVDFITLHPKTINQKPSRAPHWSLIKSASQAISIPLIANGGITDSTNWKKLRTLTGVNSWMIGRGAIEKPWIFNQLIHGNRAKEINLRELLVDFLQLLVEYQPQEFHLSRAKRFSLYFHKNLLYGYHLHFKEVYHAENLQKIEALYTNYFLRNPQEELLNLP
jgi:tRNA-dihydrouridine synthase B